MRCITLCLAAVAWAAPAAADVLRCPPGGTQAKFANGVVVTYSAPNPGAVDLCPWTNKVNSGASAFGLFGGNATSRELGEAVAKVYARGAGATGSYDQKNGMDVGWRLAIEFEAMERIPVGNQERDAARIRIDTKGVIPNYSQTITRYWIDTQTHVVLRRRFELVRGNQPAESQSKPLDVIALTVPR